MKEKILYWGIMITGIFCLFIYVGTRFLPLMNVVLVEKMDLELQEFIKYGDLYYNNCIDNFKEDLPDQLRRYRLSDENPDVNDANILTYGDSFFDISFQRTLPERLADTLNDGVFSYITQDPTQSNPFCLLNQLTYKKTDKPRIFILESAERNIPTKYGKPYDIHCEQVYVAHKTLSAKLWHEYIFKSSAEQLFNLVLKRSYLTYRIYSKYATLKFNWFGTISSLTPVYKDSPDDPWLFYKNSVDNGPGSFNYDFGSEEVEYYASNLATLAENLKHNFNLEMIFMAVPNKYTLYSGKVNNDIYKGFIPALQEALDRKGVKYVDLYTRFSSSTETLYYGTDTHWNKSGVDIAVELTLQALEE